jgi:hypothetical protein
MKLATDNIINLKVWQADNLHEVPRAPPSLVMEDSFRAVFGPEPAGLKSRQNSVTLGLTNNYFHGYS